MTPCQGNTILPFLPATERLFELTRSPPRALGLPRVLLPETTDNQGQCRVCRARHWGPRTPSRTTWRKPWLCIFQKLTCLHWSQNWRMGPLYSLPWKIHTISFESNSVTRFILTRKGPAQTSTSNRIRKAAIQCVLCNNQHALSRSLTIMYNYFFVKAVV